MDTYADVARALISRGADLEATNCKGRTELSFVALSADALSQEGVQSSGLGAAPLRLVCMSALLAAGADPRCEDVGGHRGASHTHPRPPRTAGAIRMGGRGDLLQLAYAHNGEKASSWPDL